MLDSRGIPGLPVVLTARRLATTLGDCETDESAGEQRKSAVQQERKLPEIMIEAKILRGSAERPPHCGSGIIDANCGHVDFDERQRNGCEKNGAGHYRR
jgi:hypothetical protein